ncbi:MAG: hypothetical protein EBT03_08095 [Betaproteobacteria bacterium]|nr:hypothetical protein [Betaproteobacteria bacterium]NCA16912.1 hypothetical protein [Betaproteobacteria bacterium]
MTVLCADGVERQQSDCRQTHDGEWHPADVCCTTADGRVFLEADTVADYNGDIWPAVECSSLANGEYAHESDEDIVYCYDGEYRHISDCSEVCGNWYPDRMVEGCSDCDGTMLRDDAFHDEDGDAYCSECWRYEECDQCGLEYHRDREDGCPRCDAEDSTEILPYSSQAANRLQPEHQGKELLGIELEVIAVGGDRERAAAFIRQHVPKKYCVFKEDGSLGPNGFEIVTRRDSMEVHRRVFTHLLSQSPAKYMRSWNTTTPSDPSGVCGIHIHVNRKWLSQLQLGKMLVFLNDINNRRFVCGLAGRTGSSWAKMKHKKVSDANRHDERYVALNIKEKTAELRIFRGTVSLPGFIKNLEFTRALVEFTAPSARSIKQATSWEEFVKWVPRKTYPTLHEYLCDKWYRNDRPKKRGE